MTKRLNAHDAFPRGQRRHPPGPGGTGSPHGRHELPAGVRMIEAVEWLLEVG